MSDLDHPFYPLDQELIHALPKDRPYTPIEAAFSYQAYLNLPPEKRTKTINEWARFWKWSYGITKNFLEKTSIRTEESQTKTRRNIKFNFIKSLDASDKSQTKVRQKPDESQTKANIKNKKEEKENTNPPIIPPAGERPQSKAPAKVRDERYIFTVPDWIPQEAWDAFLEMRQKIKKPLTEYAKYLLVKELEKLKLNGNPPEMVLNQSTLKNWQGIFPLPDAIREKLEAEKEKIRIDALVAKHYEESKQKALAGLGPDRTGLKLVSEEDAFKDFILDDDAEEVEA